MANSGDKGRRQDRWLISLIVKRFTARTPTQPAEIRASCPRWQKNNSKEQPAITARNHQKQPAITDTRFVRRSLRSRKVGRHTGCACFTLMTLEYHAIMAFL
jgi:hypothetical protein